MRAALVEEFGPPSALSVAEVAEPMVGNGQVLIEVAAFSVNFPDLMVIDGTYQNLPPRPFSPGKEAAGTVVAIGDGVTRLSIGDRVLAIVEHGAYSEKLATSEEFVTPLPDSTSFIEAAALGLVGSTAHLGLLRRAHLQPGETALITGAGGGVGSMGVQLAKAHGARVIAHARDETRAELARQQGADVVLTCAPDALRLALLDATAGAGVDVVLETLGGDYLTQIVRATAWEGRIVIVGFASGSQNPVKPGHLLVKNISMLGLQSSDYRDRTPEVMRTGMADIFDLHHEGKITAFIDTVFSFHDVAAALQRVKNGNVKGKVVVTTATNRGNISG